MATIQESISTAREYVRYALRRHRNAINHGGRQKEEPRYKAILAWIEDIEQVQFPEQRCYNLIDKNTDLFIDFLVGKFKDNEPLVKNFLNKYQPK